jgi:hypothetical protein
VPVHLNLDTHPVVTRLQNEQNQRLEGMEQRMDRIRKSAQQEAERRKFARLFRAPSEDKAKEALWKEASLALELMKKEKEMRKAQCQQRLQSGDSDHTAAQSDQGQIIPVHVVSPSRCKDTEEKVVECTTVATPSSLSLKWLLQPAVDTFHLGKCSASIYKLCVMCVCSLFHCVCSSVQCIHVQYTLVIRNSHKRNLFK